MAGLKPSARAAAPARSGGKPLAPALRRRLEPLYGQSLAAVRVHTQGEPAQTTARLGAQAITLGRDIAFAPGRWAPHTQAGLALLAHELAHSLQQGQGGQGVAGPQAEAAADAAAQAVLAGQRVPPQPAARGPHAFGVDLGGMARRAGAGLNAGLEWLTAGAGRAGGLVGQGVGRLLQGGGWWATRIGQGLAAMGEGAQQGLGRAAVATLRVGQGIGQVLDRVPVVGGLMGRAARGAGRVGARLLGAGAGLAARTGAGLGGLLQRLGFGLSGTGGRLPARGRWLGRAVAGSLARGVRRGWDRGRGVAGWLGRAAGLVGRLGVGIAHGVAQVLGRGWVRLGAIGGTVLRLLGRVAGVGLDWLRRLTRGGVRPVPTAPGPWRPQGPMPQPSGPMPQPSGPMPQGPVPQGVQDPQAAWRRRLDTWRDQALLRLRVQELFALMRLRARYQARMRPLRFQLLLNRLQQQGLRGELARVRQGMVLQRWIGSMRVMRFRARWAALRGDDSEAGRARRARLLRRFQRAQQRHQQQRARLRRRRQRLRQRLRRLRLRALRLRLRLMRLQLRYRQARRRLRARFARRRRAVLRLHAWLGGGGRSGGGLMAVQMGALGASL